MENVSVVQQTAILVIQLGAIIFAAKFCGDLFQKIKMPSVLGELLAGILLGPFLLGAVGLPFHGFEHGFFPHTPGATLPVSMPLYSIATIGSVLLLFLSGLETDLRMFLRYSVAGTLVGIGGVIFSFGFGAGIGMVMLSAAFMDPRCLFLGILCTATSVGITARILSERRSIDSPEGVTILAAAVIDDVLGIICLAIVMGIVAVASGGGGEVAHVDWPGIGRIAAQSVGIWLGATVLGLLLARKIAHFLRIFGSATVFGILALALALIVSGLFEQAGLAMIIGAYVLGLALSKTDISFAVQRALLPVYNFMVPVFFVVMGMMVDLRVFGNPTVLKMGMIYAGLAVAAKIIGCALPALFMNFNVLGALRIGAGMVPRGEVALIIAGIGATTMMTINGVRTPILNAELFGIAIIMTLVTTVVAPPILSFFLGLPGKGVKKEAKDHSIVHTVFKLPSDTVADFVLKNLIEAFESEGFMLSELDRRSGILHLRRDRIAFSLVHRSKEFVFESNPDEVILIKTVMYETFMILHHTMEKLRALADPAMLQRQIFSPNDTRKIARIRNDLPLGTILPFSCVKMRLQADSKEGIIAEMLDLLAHDSRITSRAQCENDLLERESIASTAMQDGVAFPHCHTDGVTNLVAAIGIKPEGFDFGAIDGKPSNIFVMSLCPKATGGPLLQFMARIAGSLADPDTREAILHAPSPEMLRELLLSRLSGK
jgi:Kef-type K+ transport system membrane component KefB/mannitol/fructose-specific phosphotransferase system IIA component (Ntr-type)